MNILMRSFTITLLWHGVMLTLQGVSVLLHSQYVTVSGLTCHTTLSSENISPGAVQIL